MPQGGTCEAISLAPRNDLGESCAAFAQCVHLFYCPCRTLSGCGLSLRTHFGVLGLVTVITKALALGRHITKSVKRCRSVGAAEAGSLAPYTGGPVLLF